MENEISDAIKAWLGAAFDEQIATSSPGNPDYYGEKDVAELAKTILAIVEKELI